MTYININITINEEPIREQANKLRRTIQTYWQIYYREAYIRACELGQRHGQKGIVAGIHKLLNHERSDFSNTILCDCRRRNCPGRTLAITTYVRRVKGQVHG